MLTKVNIHSQQKCSCYLAGNKACMYNHTLLLWKMGHVHKAVEGWAWYRELPITTHEQCQRTFQQLQKRYIVGTY